MWPRADPENQEHKLCFILYLLLDTNTPPSPPGQNRQKARSTQLKLTYHTEPCSLVYKCSNSLFSYLHRYGKTPEIRSTRKRPLRYKFSGPLTYPPSDAPGNFIPGAKTGPRRSRETAQPGAETTSMREENRPRNRPESGPKPGRHNARKSVARRPRPGVRAVLAGDTQLAARHRTDARGRTVLRLQPPALAHRFSASLSPWESWSSSNSF